MILWPFVGFLCILWIAKGDHVKAERGRRERQRAQRLGLAPIPGADGTYEPEAGED